MPNFTTDEDSTVMREEPIAGCSASEEAIKNASLTGVLNYLNSLRGATTGGPDFIRDDIDYWITQIQEKLSSNNYTKNILSDEIVNIQISNRDIPSSHMICIVGINIRKVDDSRYEPVAGSITIRCF